MIRKNQGGVELPVADSTATAQPATVPIPVATPAYEINDSHLTAPAETSPKPARHDKAQSAPSDSAENAGNLFATPTAPDTSKPANSNRTDKDDIASIFATVQQSDSQNASIFSELMNRDSNFLANEISEDKKFAPLATDNISENTCSAQPETSTSPVKQGDIPHFPQEERQATPYPDDLPIISLAVEDQTATGSHPVVSQESLKTGFITPVSCCATRDSNGVTFADLTTMRVGGAPDKAIIATTADELVEHAKNAWNNDEDLLLLGGGSNTIVSDAGYPGTALIVRTTGIEIVSEDETTGAVRVRVQAGEDWDSLVAWSVSQGLAGLEMLSGIPGSAGAAPVQNIGAYGGELKNTLASITLFDKETYEIREIPAAELALGYRTSALKTGDIAGIVLAIELVLQRTTGALSAPIVFPQLAGALDVKFGARLPLQQVRDTVLKLRAGKGMVLREEDRDSWSSGSFFMNPIVAESTARTLPADAPQWIVNPEPEIARVTPLDEIDPYAQQQPIVSKPARVKLSAAWLIENAGIPKGFRLPGSGAGISTKHTLAITNRGGATAEDVAELARYVITMVHAQFGIALHPEPNIYGLDLGA